MKNTQEYHQAERRVEEKIGFMVHASVYVLVNGMLVLINIIQGQKAWSIWPLFGWGIGLAMHGLRVGFSSNAYQFKEKMIQRELRKQRS